MPLADAKYMLFTTFRRDGTPVSSPVWVVPLGPGRVGFYTTDGSGKTKRLRHTKRVTVQPCDIRGRVDAGSASAPATAEMVKAGADFDAVKAAIRRKYGLQGRLFAFAGALAMKRRGLSYADTVVLVTLDDSARA
jgi:PPOX class probable F420-dependent enzyme